MEYNKTTFWTNTRGVFVIETEGNFNDLIALAVNQNKNEPGFEVNFNSKNDSFYVRTDTYAIRVSNRWGEVGSCKWELERDPAPEKFQLVKIEFDKLDKYNKPHLENNEQFCRACGSVMNIMDDECHNCFAPNK